MSVYSGDFLGFTLGDIHSSQLNITRVSSGDRYDDNLLPSFKDVTMEIPGGDGLYYWNSFYSQRQFVLNFAYDDLRDEDLRKLRQVFGFKGIQPLIFDELPYKKYMVKCANSPIFKYICFDHRELRLYKGEGSVTLVAYYPYALATANLIFTDKNNVTIINEGDLDAELDIYYTAAQINNLSSLELTQNDKQIGILTFNPITLVSGDSYLLINSKTHLIEGLNNLKKKTGHLYNKYIKSGDFFEAPIGKSVLTSNVNFDTMQCIRRYY